MLNAGEATAGERPVEGRQGRQAEERAAVAEGSVNSVWSFTGDTDPGITRMRARGRPLVLPPAAEAAIVSTFITFALIDTPLSASDLPAVARRVSEDNGAPAFKATRKWCQAFRKRHDLRARKPRPLSKVRYRSMTPSVVEAWFGQVEKAYLRVFGTTTPPPNRVWNVDESPFNPQASGVKVITTKGHTPIQTVTPYKEFFTVAACVSGQGDLATPLLILDGAHVRQDWYPPQDWTGTVRTGTVGRTAMERCGSCSPISRQHAEASAPLHASAVRGISEGTE